MTKPDRRRLSTRAASSLLVALATACAFLALSPSGVADAETAGTTTTGVAIESPTTTAEETFGGAGTVDPTTTTTAPEATTTSTTAPEVTTTTQAPAPEPGTTTTTEPSFGMVTVPPASTTTLLAPANGPSTTVPPSTTAPPTTGAPATTTAPPTTAAPSAPSAPGAPTSPAPTVANQPAPTPTTSLSSRVIAGELAGGDRLTEESALDQTVTLGLSLPGQDSQINIQVRPSRLAAAWLLWVTVSLFVVAFWLPAPARRMLGSSVPRGSRR